MTDNRVLAAAIASTAGSTTGNLVRRSATVTAVNSDGTADVTWPTGDAVASLPMLCDPWPVIGDVVLLIGAGTAVKDYAIWGIIQSSSRPQAGRGILAHVDTSSDSSTSAGAAEYEVTEMRTPTAQFYVDRRYRSTINFGLQAQVANDFGTLRLKRSGAVEKNKAEGITIKNGPEPSSVLNFTFDFVMPTGTYYMYITIAMSTRQVQFRALTTAFHTVEDIGPL